MRAAAGWAARPAVAAARDSITVDGRPRTFVSVTAAKSAVKPAAVLLVLHGSSQTGRKLRSFSGRTFDHLAAGGRVAVVYPDALKKLWNHAAVPAGGGPADDVAFLAALMDHFQARFGPVPVVAAGYSNGGQMVIRLVHEIPDRLAGAAILGATLPAPGGMPGVDQRLALPVLLIHGTRDLVVPYRGEGGLWGLGARHRGPSAPETARHFAARNGHTAAPVEEPLPHHRGPTRVVATRYEQAGHLPVVLYTVVGGGHVVPNPHKKAFFLLGRTTRDIDAADAVAEFFPDLRA